jgi:hypothetical protein
MRVTQPAAICASSPTFVCVMHQREEMLDERACLEEEEEEEEEEERFNNL